MLGAESTTGAHEAPAAPPSTSCAARLCWHPNCVCADHASPINALASKLDRPFCGAAPRACSGTDDARCCPNGCSAISILGRSRSARACEASCSTGLCRFRNDVGSCWQWNLSVGH